MCQAPDPWRDIDCRALREPPPHRLELLVGQFPAGIAAFQNLQGCRLRRRLTAIAGVCANDPRDPPDDESPKDDHPHPTRGHPPAPAVVHVPHHRDLPGATQPAHSGPRTVPGGAGRSGRRRNRRRPGGGDWPHRPARTIRPESGQVRAPCGRHARPNRPRRRRMQYRPSHGAGFTQRVPLDAHSTPKSSMAIPRLYGMQFARFIVAIAQHGCRACGCFASETPVESRVRYLQRQDG